MTTHDTPSEIQIRPLLRRLGATRVKSVHQRVNRCITTMERAVENRRSVDELEDLWTKQGQLIIAAIKETASEVNDDNSFTDEEVDTLTRFFLAQLDENVNAALDEADYDNPNSDDGTDELPSSIEGALDKKTATKVKERLENDFETHSGPEGAEDIRPKIRRIVLREMGLGDSLDEDEKFHLVELCVKFVRDLLKNRPATPTVNGNNNMIDKIMQGADWVGLLGLIGFVLGIAVGSVGPVVGDFDGLWKAIFIALFAALGLGLGRWIASVVFGGTGHTFANMWHKMRDKDDPPSPPPASGDDDPDTEPVPVVPDRPKKTRPTPPQRPGS